jgi:hypothetical protein
MGAAATIMSVQKLPDDASSGNCYAEPDTDARFGHRWVLAGVTSTLLIARKPGAQR